MAINDYHFITRWRMQSTVEDISQIICNASDLVRWWPSVYLGVTSMDVVSGRLSRRDHG
jgi:hypothetical protein